MCNGGGTLIKSGLSEKIKEIRTAMHYTQQEFAKAIDLKLPSLRDYEQSKSVPGGNVIASMVDIGVNANWLLTGAGEMLACIDLTFAQKEIVKRFRRYHEGDVTCQSLAKARESFVNQYHEGIIEEDTAWLYEQEPEITQQQLILWDNSYHSGKYLFETSSESILDTSILRQATEVIEKVSKEHHLMLPLWVIGRIQELVVNNELTLVGIKPVMMILCKFSESDAS